MRNIGLKSRSWLHQIEIHSLEDLRECGAVATFKLTKSQQSGVSLNLLWALEGAIEDIDWRQISDERKLELKKQVKGDYFHP